MKTIMECHHSQTSGGEILSPSDDFREKAFHIPRFFSVRFSKIRNWIGFSVLVCCMYSLHNLAQYLYRCCVRWAVVYFGRVLLK